MDKTVNLAHEIKIKIFFSLDKNCPGGILAMSPGGKIQILQIPSLDNINSLEEKQEKIMQIANCKRKLLRIFIDLVLLSVTIK